MAKALSVDWTKHGNSMQCSFGSASSRMEMLFDPLTFATVEVDVDDDDEVADAEVSR